MHRYSNKCVATPAKLPHGFTVLCNIFPWMAPKTKNHPQGSPNQPPFSRSLQNLFDYHTNSLGRLASVGSSQSWCSSSAKWDITYSYNVWKSRWEWGWNGLWYPSYLLYKWIIYYKKKLIKIKNQYIQLMNKVVIMAIKDKEKSPVTIWYTYVITKSSDNRSQFTMPVMFSDGMMCWKIWDYFLGNLSKTIWNITPILFNLTISI